MRLVARQPGVLAGMDLARIAFGIMDQVVDIRVEREDGARLRPGDTIATVAGSARAILGAERSALHLLRHVSGVASSTASIAITLRLYGLIGIVASGEEGGESG